MLLLAGGAQGALINYYSFNGQNTNDEAGVYSQNGGMSATNANMTGAAGVSYVAGIGRSYDPSQTADYALYVKFGQQFNLPGADADLALGQAFTVEMWVHAGAGGGFTNNTSATFMTATDFNITKAGYGDPGTRSAKIGASTNGNVTTWSGTGWHQIALVSDGTTGTYYYDGVATSVGPVGTMATNISMAIGVAGSGGNYSPGMDVYIDDLAMWNESRSAAQIAIDATATGPGLGLTVAPEPATMAVLALGGVAALLKRKRR